MIGSPHNLLFLIFIIPILFSCSKRDMFSFEEGDLLFQQSDCGDFCEAINKVTDGVKGIDFNHVGILLSGNNGKWLVLEAVSKGVKETPLDEFLDRAKDRSGRPLVAVGRLKDGYRNAVSHVAKSGGQFLGKSYDEVFDIDNDAYYCSELVYLLYQNENGQSLFELKPMTFKDPDSHETFEIWKEYFDKMNQEIPEGKPGLNPGGISRSDKLDIYFPYSDFQN